MGEFVRLHIYDDEPADISTAVRDDMVGAGVACIDDNGDLWLEDAGSAVAEVLRSFGVLD